MESKSKGMLVVDDDENFYRSICASWKQEFEVHFAPTAQAALDLVEREDIAVCLMDYRLPDMNGLSLLQIFHKNNPDIPVIFISGYLNEQLKEDALSFDF